MTNKMKRETLPVEETERLANELFGEAKNIYSTTWTDSRTTSNQICATVLSYHAEYRKDLKYTDAISRFFELVEQDRQPKTVTTGFGKKQITK